MSDLVRTDDVLASSTVTTRRDLYLFAIPVFLAITAAIVGVICAFDRPDPVSTAMMPYAFGAAALAAVLAAIILRWARARLVVARRGDRLILSIGLRQDPVEIAAPFRYGYWWSPIGRGQSRLFFEIADQGLHIVIDQLLPEDRPSPVGWSKGPDTIEPGARRLSVFWGPGLPAIVRAIDGQLLAIHRQGDEALGAL